MKAILLGVALALVAAAQSSAQTVLKLNSPAPPRSYMHAGVFDGWVEAVEKDSGGTLKIEKFYGGTLGNFGVAYDRTVDGVSDIGWTLTALTGGKFKQQDVAALPFETKDANESAVALWKLYEKGITAGEFGQVKLLAVWTFPNAALHTKEPLRSLDDLKGKKLSVSNAISGKMAILLGATPVTLRPDEVYQAISRGLADGAMMPFTGMETFKIHEVAKMHLDVALGSDSAALFMNKARYDALPAQAKAAIDKNVGLGLSQKFGKATTDEWLRARGNVKETVSSLIPEQEKHWKTVLEPATKEWMQATPDGTRVLETFRAEVAAMRK
jgi:TRAP-type C4-dicarboxylate transport system substrate-binding protein